MKLFTFRRPRLPLGARGETVAAKYLQAKGYRVLKRNLRLRIGEIDLLCLAPDRKTVVLVEVKTRRRGDMAPESNITFHKKRKLLSLARVLKKMKQYSRSPLRIDVIALVLPEGGEPVIRHYENAITT